MRKKKPISHEEAVQKIRSCKLLQGKSVADVCGYSGFLSNLEAYINAQREERRIALEHAAQFGGGKRHAPAHPIDKTMEWSAEQFRDEFLRVLAKTSNQPKAVREYVEQLGKQAYNVTIANIVILEFPELRGYFFKNSKVV